MNDKKSLENILKNMRQVDCIKNTREKLNALDSYYEVLKTKIAETAIELNTHDTAIAKHQTDIIRYNERLVPRICETKSLDMISTQLGNTKGNLNDYFTTLKDFAIYVNETLFEEFTEKKILHENPQNHKFVAYLSCIDNTANVKRDMFEDPECIVIPVKKNDVQKILAPEQIKNIASDGYNIYRLKTKSKRISIGELVGLANAYLVDRFNGFNSHNMVPVRFEETEVDEEEGVYMPEKRTPALEARINPNRMVYH